VQSSRDFCDVPKTEYAALFLNKVSQCRPICDFASSSPRAERDIRRKSVLLAQLAAAFGLPYLAMSLSPSDLAQFYETIALNLFGRSPPDVTDGLDAAWPHLSLCYSALAASFCVPNAATVIGRRVVASLVRATTSFDRREREIASKTLFKLHQTFSAMRGWLTASIYSTVLQDLCSNELLDFVAAIAGTLTAPITRDDAVLYCDAILHIFSLPRVYPKLILVVVKFVGKSGELFPDTVSYLLYHWPLTTPGKEIFFIETLRRLIGVFPGYFTPRMIQAVLRAVAGALRSEHSDTTFAALEFVKDDNVGATLQVFGEGVPGILDALRAVSIGHWDADARAEAGSEYATIARIAESPRLGKQVGEKQKVDQSGRIWQAIRSQVSRRYPSLSVQ
jgi:hypothetical protein